MYTLKKYWNFTFRLRIQGCPYEGLVSDDDLFTNLPIFPIVLNKHERSCPATWGNFRENEFGDVAGVWRRSSRPSREYDDAALRARP
jgi:hypothetical protein